MTFGTEKSNFETNDGVNAYINMNVKKYGMLDFAFVAEIKVIKDTITLPDGDLNFYILIIS